MALRAQRIADFISDRPPGDGVMVQLLCEDHVGTYTLPFLCLWTEAGWTNASTMASIEVEVLGWRSHQPRGVVRAARKGAMTASAFFGFVIGVNIAIMATGVHLVQTSGKARCRRARRAVPRALHTRTAPRRPAPRCRFLVEDERDMAAQLEAMHLPHLGWVDATTLLRVRRRSAGLALAPLSKAAPGTILRPGRGRRSPLSLRSSRETTSGIKVSGP